MMIPVKTGARQVKTLIDQLKHNLSFYVKLKTQNKREFIKIQFKCLD